MSYNTGYNSFPMIVHLTFVNQGDKRKKNLIVASIKKNIKI